MAALVAERLRLYEQLERRVSIRTDQLKLTNDELHVEIAARERVQGALRSSEGRLLEAHARMSGLGVGHRRRQCGGRTRCIASTASAGRFQVSY